MHPNNSRSLIRDDEVFPRPSQEFIQLESWGKVASLDDFLGALPTVVYQCTTALKVTNISTNSTNLLAIAPFRLLGNRSLWEDRTYPDDQSKRNTHLERLIRGESGSLIYRIVNDRGLPVWISHSYMSVPLVSGTVVRGCITPLLSEDCIDKIDADVVSQFVHKIGNHFQLINLLISSLRRNVVQSHEVNLLEQSVDRAVEFTRKFSDYSQGLTCRSEFDLNEILQMVIQSALPIFQEKRVSLKNLVVEFPFHAGVHGDPMLLEFALGSLLRNALEATDIGGEVVVQCKIDHHPSMGDVGKVSISDSGNGIEGDDLGHVREPFCTTKRDRDGLGLSHAARIIDLHGGVLSMASVIGRGTTVDIHLPLTRTGPTSER
jgi:signal transduction histidine kinase